MSGKGEKTGARGERKKPSAFHAAAVKAGLPPLNGKDAVGGTYRAQITAKKGTKFTGSVDMDGHFKILEPDSNRWDYGIGLALSDGSEIACWVEPHPASSTGEVRTMLSKLTWLRTKLDGQHFKQLNTMTFTCSQGIHRFHWLLTAEGGCRITANSKEAKLLAKAGLRMPARQLTLP